MWVSSTRLFVFIVSSMMIVMISLYANVTDEASVSFVTHDSLSYRTQAVESCGAPMAPFMQTLKDFDLIGFNWTTIVSIGASLCSVSYEYLDLLVLMANGIIVLLTISRYRSILSVLRFSPERLAIFGIVYFMQLYYLAGVISLNKEVYGFLAVAVFLSLLLAKKPMLLLFFAVLFGLIKIQYLMLGVYLLFVLLGVKNRYMLIGMSLALSLIYQFTDMAIFNLDVYYARFAYPISTEGITRILNEIVAYPFGYLVVLPARLAITVLAGLNPLSVSADSALSVLYFINSLLFSVLCILSVYWVAVSRVRFDSLIFKFIIGYVAVMGMVPFIQLRYFMPLVPVLLILLISSGFSTVRYGVLKSAKPNGSLSGV